MCVSVKEEFLSTNCVYERKNIKIWKLKKLREKKDYQGKYGQYRVFCSWKSPQDTLKLNWVQ